MAIDPNDPSPLQIFAAAIGIGALAGFASALRSAAVLTGRYVGSSVLTASLTALLTCLIGHQYVKESGNVYFLLGVSGLAGYGGATLLDSALAMLIRFVGAKVDQAAGKTPKIYEKPPSDDARGDKS